MCRRCFALEQLLASVSRKTFIYAWTITGQAARVAMARMSRYHRARRRGRDSFTSAGRVLHPLPPFFLVRAMPGDQHHLASSHLTILHYTIGSCSQRTRASCVTWGGGGNAYHISRCPSQRFIGHVDYVTFRIRLSGSGRFREPPSGALVRSSPCDTTRSSHGF